MIREDSRARQENHLVIELMSPDVAVCSNVGMRGFEPSLGWWKPSVVADPRDCPHRHEQAAVTKTARDSQNLAYQVFFGLLADCSSIVLNDPDVTMYTLRS